MKVGWTMQAINDLASVARGKSRHRPRNEPSLFGGEYPFLQTADIHNADLYITNYSQTYSEKGLEQSKLWEPETICITNAGENTGDCAILGIRACFPDSVIGIVTDPMKSDTTFLKYAIDRLRPQFRKITRGATQDNLSIAKLLAFKFPAPPVPTQRRIGGILRRYGDLIDNNRRRMALLEEAARQLYCEWFVRLRFPGHEHTRITNGVPEAWERVRLGERVTLNYGKSLKAEGRSGGPYPVYGSSGIVGTHNKALATAPGIVVGRKGNVGSVYWCSKNYWPIDTVYFIDSRTSNLWLYYAFQHMHFISTGVAVPGLNRDFAYSRPLLVPEPRIVREFLETAAPLHQQIAKLGEMNQKLHDARDLLLPRLMSGEIAV